MQKYIRQSTILPTRMETRLSRVVEKRVSKAITRVAFVAVTFLVHFLTMASTAGREIMNGEVAGSILTVFPVKRKKKGFFH